MKQEYCAVKRFFADEKIQVLLNGSPFDPALVRRGASATFLWRNGTGRNVPRYVIAFPIFQQKGGRRDTRIPVHGKTIPREFSPVGIVPKFLGRSEFKRLFVASWVVIAKDQEDVRIFRAQELLRRGECRK